MKVKVCFLVYLLSITSFYGYWLHDFKGLEVYSTYKDVYGYIWICTEAGLYKYNGSEIQYFDTKDNLPSSVVFGVHQFILKDTFLLVRTFDPRLVLYSYKSNTFFQLPNKHLLDTEDFFLDILDGDSLTLFLSRTKAYSFNKNTFEIKRIGLFLNDSLGIHFNELNATVRIYNIWKEPNIRPFYIRLKPSFVPYKNNYYVFYENYLYVFKKDKSLIERKGYPFVFTDVAKPDTGSTVLIATENKGIFIFNLTTGEYKSFSYEVKHVNSVNNTLENQYWFATSMGIIIYNTLKDEFRVNMQKTNHSVVLDYLFLKNYKILTYNDTVFVVSNTSKPDIQFIFNKKAKSGFPLYARDISSTSTYYYLSGYNEIYKISKKTFTITDTIPIRQRIQSFEVVNDSVFLVGRQEDAYLCFLKKATRVGTIKLPWPISNVVKIIRFNNHYIFATYADGIYICELGNLTCDLYRPWGESRAQFIKFITRFGDNKLLILTNENLILSELDSTCRVKKEIIYNLRTDLNFERVQKVGLFKDTLYLQDDSIFAVPVQILLNNEKKIFEIKKILFQNHLVRKNDTINVHPDQKLSFFVFHVDHLQWRDILRYKVTLDGINEREGFVEKEFFTISLNKPGIYRVSFLYANRELFQYDFYIRVLHKWYQTTLGKILIVFAILLFLVVITIIFLKIQKRKYEKKIEIVNYQINFLYNQLQPHYLSNALNSLLGLIKLNLFKEAEEYLLLISTYFRDVIKTNKLQYISVSSEIEMIEKYLRIEKRRLQERLRYEINVDNHQEINYLKIPSMCVHPFVENAIKHGLDENNQTISIRIDVKIGEEKVIFVVENSGKWKPKHDSVGSGLGLELIQKRLSLFNKSYFQIEKSDNGVRVSIHFKLS